MPNNEKETINEPETTAKHSNGHQGMTHSKIIHRHGTPLMIGLVTVAGILFITAVAAVTSNVFLHNRSGYMFGRNNDSTYNRRGDNYSGNMMRNGGGMMGLRGYSSNRTSSSDVTSGVVVSTGDNSFVIAGGGNQYNVSTTGNTTYNTTDKKVTVNDSVVVIGTVTDKTISASDIRIINY